ncbi:hypothetical protein DLREEDagrD3_23780 [Denitratisoma sp. agr-D3]
MIQTQGRIIAIHDGKADVELAQTTACTSCNSKKSCSSSQDQGRTQVVSMEAPLHARAGDQVTVLVSTGGFHTGALLAYLLPSVTTLLGAMLLSPAGDAASALGLFGGLALGLGLVRVVGKCLPGLLSAHCEPLSTSHPSL